MSLTFGAVRQKWPLKHSDNLTSPQGSHQSPVPAAKTSWQQGSDNRKLQFLLCRSANRTTDFFSPIKRKIDLSRCHAESGPPFFPSESIRCSPLTFLRSEKHAASRGVGRGGVARRSEGAISIDDTAECTSMGSRDNAYGIPRARLHAVGPNFYLARNVRRERTSQPAIVTPGGGRRRSCNFTPNFPRNYFPDKSFPRCQWSQGRYITGYYAPKESREEQHLRAGVVKMSRGKVTPPRVRLMVTNGEVIRNISIYEVEIEVVICRAVNFAPS